MGSEFESALDNNSVYSAIDGEPAQPFHPCMDTYEMHDPPVFFVLKLITHSLSNILYY